MVSHLCPWLFIRAVTAWGTFTFIFCHRVSLSASLTKTTVAGTAWRHGGHPRPLGPIVWTGMRPGAAMPSCLHEDPQCSGIFSRTKRFKSRVPPGSPNFGALVKSVFISLKAFSYSGPHSRGPLPDPAVALNKACLAISEKPGIQIWQNPAAPRNSRTSFLVFGQGIEQMGCFLSCPSAQGPFEMTDPTYLTSCLQI